MERNDRILSMIDPEGSGIEIGPSHAPIAPKSSGYKVEIIDHADRKNLIEKYTGHNVDLSSIEEVDHIWMGEPYQELVGKANAYDWIIASHVIEHTPDFISFLNNCDSILKHSGALILAIPDKRYCFDHFRPNTGLSRIIDSHFEKRTIHTPGSAAEFYINVISKGGKLSWSPNETGPIEFIHSPEEARRQMQKADEASDYTDLHSWCFTPSSFRLIIHDLNLLGLIGLKEQSYQPTGGSEFIISLSRQGNGPELCRSDLVEKSTHE